MKRVIHTYRTVLHGQEVEVKVYEPATEDDVALPVGDATYEDLDCDVDDGEEPDLYDDLTEKNLWRRLAEDEDE